MPSQRASSWVVCQKPGKDGERRAGEGICTFAEISTFLSDITDEIGGSRPSNKVCKKDWAIIPGEEGQKKKRSRSNKGTNARNVRSWSEMSSWKNFRPCHLKSAPEKGNRESSRRGKSFFPRLSSKLLDFWVPVFASKLKVSSKVGNSKQRGGETWPRNLKPLAWQPTNLRPTLHYNMSQAFLP